MRQWIDNGNGRIKGKASNGMSTKVLSIVGSGFNRKLKMGNSESEGINEDLLHVGISELDEPTPKPKEIFVGKLARSESIDGQRVFNINSKMDKRSLYAIATVSALLNPHNHPINSLTLGLPLGLFNEQREEFKDFVEQANLKIEFRSGGINKTPTIFRPRKVQVVPQAIAGLYGYLYDHQGNRKQPDLVGLIAGVDIGWVTTDFIVIEIGLDSSISVRGDMSDTIEVGLSSVIDITRSYLENEYGSVNANEFENQLTKNPERIIYQGKVMDMRDMWETAKEQVSLTIVNAIRQKWRDKANYISKTILFGGGADDLGYHLRETFMTEIDIPEQPDTTNLLGFETMDYIQN